MQRSDERLENQPMVRAGRQFATRHGAFDDGGALVESDIPVGLLEFGARFVSGAGEVQQYGPERGLEQPSHLGEHVDQVRAQLAVSGTGAMVSAAPRIASCIKALRFFQQR